MVPRNLLLLPTLIHLFFVLSSMWSLELGYTTRLRQMRDSSNRGRLSEVSRQMRLLNSNIGQIDMVLLSKVPP